MDIRFSLGLALLGCATLSPAGLGAPLPADTALPVMFAHTLDSAKVKAGDAVTLRTMQVVFLPGGEQLAKGTTLTGHVIEARPFHHDDTPYAVQQPSYLAVQIDQVAGNAASPITTSVRAMADSSAVAEALSPQRFDDISMVGTTVLVGGAHYSMIAHEVTAGPYEDTVGYNRKQGVFARLLPGGAGCEGSGTEQSVAIFSPDACGLYGFLSDRLTQSGGTFRLESTHYTVKIRAGSAALLQVR